MDVIIGVIAGMAVVLGGAPVLCRWAIRHASAQPVVLVNLRLPSSYVRRIVRGRACLFVVPLAADAYGRFWEPGVISLCRDVEFLKRRSAEPRKQWPENESYHFACAADAWAIDPYFVPYVIDFSRLLMVGRDCQDFVFLDFRETPDEPSVIYWNGVYWQRVAPDCASFLALLEPWLARRHRNWRLAALHGPGVDGCVTVALEAIARYDIWDTDVLIWLVWSEQNEPTVVLLPDPRDDRWERAGRPDWQIWVSVPPGLLHAGMGHPEGGVKITERGTVRKYGSIPSGPTLGQVVAAVSRHFTSQSGGPGMRGVVSVRRLPDNVSVTLGRYMVDVRAVERWIEIRPKIWVSDDLTQVRIGPH